MDIVTLPLKLFYYVMFCLILTVMNQNSQLTTAFHATPSNKKLFTCYIMLVGIKYFILNR